MANGGTLSNLQQVNATTFTATFTGNAGTDIGNAAVVVDNTWHEANGNTGTGGSFTLHGRQCDAGRDGDDQQCQRQRGARHGDDHLQFQRSADRLRPGSRHGEQQHAKQLQQVNATTFTATFTGNAGTDIGNAAVVVDNTWHEANGNTGTGGSTSFTVDSVTPGVTVTTNNTDVNVAHGTATITFSFSEAPTDFGLGHVTANGGTLSNLQQVNTTTFTATFTGNAGTDIGNAAVVVDNTWHEANGNTGTGGSTSFTVDSVTPGVTVTTNNTDVNVAHGTATITFSFSETPGSSFVLATDTTATGGALSNLQQVNATTFTATFTANANTYIGNAAVSVIAGGWTENNGNIGTGGVRPPLWSIPWRQRWRSPRSRTENGILRPGR